jgi:hypothetical protein
MDASAEPPAQKPDFDDIGAFGLSFRGWITFLVILTTCLLVLLGKAVPEIIENMAFVCLGFYFNKNK